MRTRPIDSIDERSVCCSHCHLACSLDLRLDWRLEPAPAKRRKCSRRLVILTANGHTAANSRDQLAEVPMY